MNQDEMQNHIKAFIERNPVVLFMKGTKLAPMCGFSAKVVQILLSHNVPFETVNVLESDLIRQGIKDFSNWPTIPQLYIQGEFIGGCDIVTELEEEGKLKELLAPLIS